MKLTEKEEKACQEYILNGGNKTQAYKSAYNYSKMKDKTANEKASILFSKDKIRARLEELKKPLQEKFEYSMEQSFKKFNELQELALKRISIAGFPNPDVANAIKCEENKAKLMGLYANEKLDINTNVKKVFITKADEKEANKKIDDFINNIDV